MIGTDKMALRQTMRERLRKISTDRAEKSEAICRSLAAQPEYVAARRVAIFDGMASEPSLEPLWQMAPKSFLYPRVTGEILELVAVADLLALETRDARGSYREPVAGSGIELETLDLLVVPGLAFTREGWRMGRGGGFYDRLLARLPARVTTIGVCFDLQLLKELPLDSHDLRVQRVITESGAYSFGRIASK